ncbi:MAG: hypothetical protein HC890_05050 [Chloroflexaceae bacterium]|nr:hypothetical protein [Chloroflexaceae bacterium]
MERGLLWLPLLGVFIWLAGAGWREFKKVEAYQQWAESFDRAKYDIYAVLGLKAGLLTWGKPTRHGPTDTETFSLAEIEEIQLLVDNKPVTLDKLPQRGRVALAFSFSGRSPIVVPFTEIELAAKWERYLQQERRRRFPV